MSWMWDVDHWRGEARLRICFEGCRCGFTGGLEVVYKGKSGCNEDLQLSKQLGGIGIY